MIIKFHFWVNYGFRSVGSKRVIKMYYYDLVSKTSAIGHTEKQTDTKKQKQTGSPAPKLTPLAGSSNNEKKKRNSSYMQRNNK